MAKEHKKSRSTNVQTGRKISPYASYGSAWKQGKYEYKVQMEKQVSYEKLRCTHDKYSCESKGKGLPIILWQI